MSLSHDFSPKTSTLRDVTVYILVFTNPHIPFNHSNEFEEGEEFKSAIEFD